MQRPNSDYLPTPDYDELEERYKRQQAEAAEMATTPEDRANDTSMSVEQKSNGDLEAVQEQTQESEEPSSRDQQKARQREEGDDGMDNPVSQFLENSAVEVRDWIDDKIQGNQRSKEEIRADRSEVRQKGRAKAAEIEDQIDNQTGLGAVYRDTTRAVLGAGEKQVQDVIGFGNLVGDTVKTRLGMVEEDDLYNNVDLPNYVGAERDMIIAEPKSQIGVAARDLIAFFGMSRRIGGAARSTGLVNTSNIIPAFGKATKAQKLTKFAADRGTEFVLGAIADLVMDPGDSNASNFIIEKIPGTAPFLGMFAIDEDDNEWEKRFKNTIEGGVLQEVVDVVGLGLRGLKAGGRQFKGWLKNNPGKKSTDAPVEVKAAAVKEYEDVIEQGLKEQEEFIQKSIDFRQGEMDLRAERQLDLDFNAGDLRKDIGDSNTGALKGDNIKAESNSVDYDEAMYRQNKDKWMEGEYTSPELPGQPKSQLSTPRVRPQAPKQPANTRPGMAARATEQAFNGSRENGSPAKLEPHERAGRSSQYPVEEVGKEQAALKGRMPFDGRGTKPAMTDNLVRQFKAASNSDEAMNIIRETYDQGMADRIAKGLASTNPDVKAKAIEDLVMLNKAVDADAVESILMEQVKQGQFTKARIQQVQGQFVAKTYIVDIANQLADDGKIYGDLVANKQDAFHQAQGMLDKILVASKLQVEAISDAARVLQSSQNLGKAAPSPDSLKKLAKTSERVNDLKKRLEIGDRKAIDEMATLAKSFTLADGDPDLVQTFFEKFFELGNKNFQTVMYNAYLSGIKTQQRNILGGFVNIVMRPAEIAMGARIERDSDTARAALSMYSTMWDSLREGWQIGRTSWANWSPDNPLNKVSTDLSTAEKVRNLRAIANTPSEHAAATLINLQYNFMAHPALQGPMRGLNAADAAFRAVSARQMTVYEMSKLAYEDGIAFNPEKFEQMWSTKMKDGRIVDEKLLQYAKEDTFQEDLGKYMQATSNYIDQIPFVKFIVPFVKTPTNILKRTAHYTPLLGRGVSFVNTQLGTTFFKEYDAVMKGTDETAKALYRGREATGALIGITFTGMGAMGLSTGMGPVTPAGMAAWKAAGIPRHSIQLPGGVWMSNRWLGPVGILMSLYADLGRIAADPGQYENGAELFAAAAAVTAGALFEQSWLQGVTGIMAAMVDVHQEKADRFDPERWAVGVSRGMIPFSAALKNFNDTLTPGLREYDEYRYKLLAETIPFAKNFLGEEVISMWSGEPKVSKGMSALDQGQPFGFREVQNDPLLQKLLDLGVDFPAEFAYKYRGVELLKADKMAMHKLFSQTNLRKNLEKQLLTDSYIHDTNYKSWQDEQRPSPRRTSGWYKNITGQIQGAMDQAYEQYVNGDSPEGLELKRKVERAKHEKYLANRNKFNELQNLQSLSE